MKNARPPVVALVCSAGGLDSLRRVLSKLPPDFGAATIVLQHQPPHQTSHLAVLLARSCALRVSVAAQGDALEAGHVYVVPPGKHALVTREARVALILSDGTPAYRPSADLLLTSLALSLGAEAIAVVLSGRGHDGATGATAVHDFGGRTIAADRESSQHYDMPAAAIGRDDAVDEVLPVDDIAARLVALIASPAKSSATLGE